VDALAARGELAGYDVLPAVRADLLRRLGRAHEACAAYEAALALARHEPERRYFRRRIAELPHLHGEGGERSEPGGGV
jgi:RNA polymerase sigma-70 factor, ECF subfamily